MERSTWTDPRLDDKMASIDNDMSAFREEMRASRAQAFEERRAFEAQMAAMRSDHNALQGRLLTVAFGFFGVTFASIAAIVVELA